MLSASKVPAATATLAVLRHLSTRGRPIPAATLAEATGVPRSTLYYLLGAMIEQGFVVHYPDEGRYGLGLAAFELGSAYSYQEPLVNTGRPILRRLVARLGWSGHVAVLHGRDMLYVVEERGTRQPPLITDVGVRLPAHLTASGRAVLAHLPRAQVRALYPDSTAFTTRHDTGPQTPSELRRVLVEVRRRGHGFVDDDVTPGMSSVASAVFDHNGNPVASIALTFPSDAVPFDAPEPTDTMPYPATRSSLAQATREAAEELGRRLSGRRGGTPQLPASKPPEA